MSLRRTFSSRFVGCLALAFATPALGVNQTATTTPVVVGGGLPYQVELRRYDMAGASVPTVHSFVAGELNGQWVVLAGLTNGLHGFDLNESQVPGGRQNRSVWVIDPVTRQTWSRSYDAASADSGFSPLEALSLSTANAQFEQVGETLFMIGGYGDNNPSDETSRGTFSTLSAIDLPGLVDWAKGGMGMAADHVRQVSDPLLAVTGGDLYEIGGQMHLVFGQDYQGRYRGSLNGEYTKQVRTFTVQDDGTTLGLTAVAASTPQEHFRRRDLNVYPTLEKQADGSLVEGITVLAGVFTPTNGYWTVPVEIDATGQPTQIEEGLDPLNAGGVLDASPAVFRQGMNVYHSAKAGLFSAATGDMHELLFGGITLQEYDPTSTAADANGFVTDQRLPNTSQMSAVVRRADGSYEQHYLGAFPEMLTDGGEPMRFGSNAEFFIDPNLQVYGNGVLDLDALAGGADAQGRIRIGYVFGGIVANAPHVFGNPTGLSAASGEVFEVILTLVIPEPTTIGLLSCLALSGGRLGARRPRRR
ncbi:hypothetical protein [Botrimarina hoheduenensis]|uniref:PEP-CTERM protein-sorting domain-containing protein n=1 Tax=Botrimarina hoheduenensis TaxID=2528000 RepID=A0A5C5WBR8_9BACT|nr:hypothetical protein [Botrimarina hoheduenensis]TWT48348.1 hypothetical protein Pla111_01110 [Botrimarina hoheduenensis]